MRIAVLLVVLGMSAGIGSACRAPEFGRVATAPADVRGVVEGLAPGERASISVHAYGPDDVVRAEMGRRVPVAPSGRFRTRVLTGGRYLLMLHAPGRPPSVVTTRVPPTGPVALRARPPASAATLILTAATGGTTNLQCRIVLEEPSLPVAALREVIVPLDGVARVEGVAPGRWRLDVVAYGATTEFDVPVVDGPAEVALRLAPPRLSRPGTSRVSGRLLYADGAPAAGLAVTVRPLVDGNTAAAGWGRFALTDSDGGYEIVGVAGGPALIRVENRDATVPRLPMPERVVIPPSGTLLRSFVVGL